MTLSSQVRFSFKNLQPMNYLRTFNRMVDHQSRTVDAPSSMLRQVRVVSLSKFPTPPSYEQMQGIFENVNKKKVEQDMHRYNKQLEEEERFMKKHNEFMRKVLEKFIQHNQERQKTYQKQKEFYAKDLKIKHIRFASESHLRKSKQERQEQKSKEKSAQVSRTENKATVGSDSGLEMMQEESSKMLPKLQPPGKKQKVGLRKEKDIENYLINRKLTQPPATVRNPENLRSSHMHLPSEDQENLDFKQEIVSLQRKQAKLQSDFSARIQKEIEQFGRKMSSQVHAINYFNFWKEPSNEQQEEKQKRRKKLKEHLQQGEERVDFQLNFRNYQSV